jgi:hypothetical protein
MADAASIISAVCSGAAVIISAAGGAYLAVRQGRALRQAEALKLDHERAARDTGQRLYGLIDKVNTLDDRTQAAQRRIERIPTESQWAFRLNQTPTERVPAMEPLPPPPPLKGPKPPIIPPYPPVPWEEDK